MFYLNNSVIQWVMTKTNFIRSTGISFAGESLIIWKLFFMQTRKNRKKSVGRVSDRSKGIEGKYSNYFEIGHNAFEFLIDFGQYYSGTEEAEHCVRIITSPFYAKALSETLCETLMRYEKAFGTIKSLKHKVNKDKVP